MPLKQYSADALQYIDAQPSDEALAAANILIQTDLAPDHATTLHPSIPPLRQSRLSDLLETEYARIESDKKNGRQSGIDMSRYEALDAPPRGDTAAWRETLQKAYTSYEYMRGREINLSLLETYGKNAWLIGNSGLEDELKSLEREVESANMELEMVENARSAMQRNAAGEMHGLEESWKTGIRRMIEAQAAAERLRQEILERRRQAAS
ncbi:hypothetical protein M433DRAFT_70434 [Acidomyces richmondensis BFW]|nr:MAG: hypothetical protein FE78DRAFT_152555 [Acidomyces sp. 'richmondensis']KYG44002.1 hypothetical protein M433DRAFT_70434 [Acidomyces richmondensis BFW]